MPETPTTYNYYPALSGLITLEDLPEILDFIKEGLQEIFDKVYYKDFQSSRNVSGSGAFYSLDIVSRGRLDLEFPGTGIFIILNPDYEDSTISSFPIQLYWEWEIMRFVRYFNANQFSFSVEGFYDLALQIFNVSEAQSLELATNAFVVISTPGISKFQQLINDINALYGSSISIDENSETRYQQLVIEIDLIGQHVFPTIFALYLFSNDAQTAKNNLNYFFSTFLPTDIESYIKELILPKARATLALSAAIEFPRNMLTPVYPEGTIIGGQDVSYQPIPEPAKAMFSFAEALFYADTTQGFGYNMDLSLSTVTPVQIGNTGLILNIHNLKIDLSTKSNFPEADADGRPLEFMGVYTEQADILLPSNWFTKDDGVIQTLKISGKHLLIGTGGISGTIALETIDTGNPPGATDFFWVKLGTDPDNAWKIGFHSFDITFSQGDIVSSNIVAGLQIPKFKKPNGDIAEIIVHGHLEANGDFKLTASTTPPYPTIEFGEVFKLHMKSVELGREDNTFFIGAAADIEFKGLLAGLLEGQGITIGAALRIYSNGRIDFKVDGGSLVLPKTVKLKIGPVELSVSAIHFGSHEREKDGQIRKYNYFGFDAGVNIGVAGIDARGDGIKFYYTVDDGPGKPHDSYLHIQTIHVDLIIPANSSDPNVMIKGWLSLPEPGGFPEYKGGVSLKIKNPRITGFVDMRLAPKYPAFLIDAGIELPNPIPLGPVAIYGFRGLLGYRYVAEKEAIGMTSANTWYEYYKAPVKGVNVNKFSRPDQTEHYSFPFSLGVGAILGDTMAAGNIISANAMLLLSLPSMVMVDARMKLLSQRVSFADDPPFFAFFIFGDNSIEFGFGADYKFPESSGDILKIYAEIQAGFFFNNASAWYINFGTRQNPIAAKLFKDIFTLKAFLMISGKGIEAGARGEFRFERRFGPVYILVLAYLEVGGKVSFERPQVGGYVEAGLAIDINVKIFRLYAAVSILLAAESPKPFLIYGAFTVEFKIKVLFFKLNFKKKLELKWEYNKDVDQTPINPFTEVPEQMGLLAARSLSAATGQGDGLVKGVSMLTNETFGLANLKEGTGIVLDLDKIRRYVVPLDTYIDIKTTKGLLPGAMTGSPIGGVSNPPALFKDMVPPEKVMKGLDLRQVEHQYSIEHLEIMAYSDTMGWQAYNPYRAVHPTSTDPMIDEMKVGQWQKKDDQYNAIRLLATTPFSYTEQGEPGWFIPEQYGITPSTLFCEGKKMTFHVSDFLEKPLNTQYYAYVGGFFHSKGAAYQIQGQTSFVMNPALTLTGDYARVSDAPNVFGFDQSLEFPNHTPLVIMLNAPSTNIELKLSTFNTGVTIDYYQSVVVDGSSFVQYELIDSVYVTMMDLQQPVETLFDPSQGVIRIVITPDVSNWAQINAIQAQMDQLMNEGYAIAMDNGGFIESVQPSNPELYEQLRANLEEYKSTGCFGLNNQYEPGACELYPNLVFEYNNNFRQPFVYYPGGEMPGEIESAIDYAQFIISKNESYNQIYAILTEHSFESGAYHTSTGQYGELLAELNLYVEAYPQPDYNESLEIISRFDPVKNKFRQIMMIIDQLRDCEDTVLCDFSTYLSYQDYIDLSIYPYRSPLLDAYYNFIEANPDYSYLDDALSHQIQWIQTILKMGRETYYQYQAEYNEACREMIDLIANLGNCDQTQNQKCVTLFHEVRWLTTANYIYNMNVPGQTAITADAQASVAGVNRFVQPVWRPDTSYYVKFRVRDDVDNGYGAGVYEYAYGFHTAGPLGFFHLDEYSPYGPVPYEEQDQYPHTSLRAYIDYERSYPNADGSLVRAKPLFYDDDTTEIKIFFTSRYAPKLLEGWEAVMDGSTVKFPELGGTMKIIIKDPLEDVEIVNPPRLDTTVENIEASEVTIPQTLEEWAEDDDPIIPPALQQYFNMLNAQNCTGMIEVIKPKSFYRKVTPKRLKPQKLYTVQVLNFYWGTASVDVSNITDETKAQYAREIHKFVFQTSRYRNFEEQVQSYLIEYKDENDVTQFRQAIYELEKELTPDQIQAALDTVKDQSNIMSDAIAQQFLDPFDRVMEGLFGFSPSEDPVTTEFNKIIDSVTGSVIALLIRNPEPFNHPKIPLEVVHRDGSDPGMIEVLQSNMVSIDTNYFMLYSKDYSQAIIMNDAKWIQTTQMNFQFLYKSWNGSEYETAGVQKIQNVLIN